VVAATLAPRTISASEAQDTLALQRLAWTYCHAIDRRDYALVRSLYHDDAVDDHGRMFCGSPDAYIAWLPSMMATWSATVHLVHNTLYLFDGDAAEGELSVTAYHRSADETRDVIVHGRYLDQYRRRDGVWRFYRRALVLDWMEDRALQPGAGLDDGVAHGQASSADPLYQRLPLFAAQRR
jgi:ketosteroid isomerase-like protein